MLLQSTQENKNSCGNGKYYITFGVAIYAIISCSTTALVNCCSTVNTSDSIEYSNLASNPITNLTIGISSNSAAKYRITADSNSESNISNGTISIIVGTNDAIINDVTRIYVKSNEYIQSNGDSWDVTSTVNESDDGAEHATNLNDDAKSVPISSIE